MGKSKEQVPAQLGQRRSGKWTRAVRNLFLDHLTATCNVRAAATAAGVSTWTVYNHRRNDDTFAAEWRSAIAQAYEIIETHLIGMALSGATEIDTGIEGAGAVLNRDMAIQLLTTRRQPLAEQRRRGGMPARTLTREQVEAALLAKLARLVPQGEAQS